jgi:outer membrane protein assembly factor BamB
MKRMLRLPVLLLLIVPLAGCIRVAPAAPLRQVNLADAEQVKKGGASDCLMLGGSPGRNMANTIDKNVPADWCVEEGKQQKVKWVAKLGSRAYGGPVIANGKVYVGTNQKGADSYEKAVLMAFNEADGKFLWKIVHDFPADPLFNMALHEGLLSTPYFEEDRLYYVTPGCEIVCADIAGKVRWTYDMMKELKVVPFHCGNCSPLVVGDLVMVISGNGRDEQENLPSPKAPSFVAVNKKTGKLAWQSNLPGDKIIQGQWTNPTLATVNGKPQIIFPGGDAVMYSFEPATGKLIWKCDCNPTRTKQGPNNYFVGTPVVVGDKLYVGLGVAPDVGAATKFSYFVCLDVTKQGDVSPKSYDAKAAVNKDSALVWAFGGMIEPPPEKGRKINFGYTISTAAIHDGLIYIPEETGYLHCLDAKTGARYWDHDFKAGVWGSAYYADGKVFVGTDDGEIVIFAAGKDKKVLATINMEEGIHMTPVVANGVLYVLTKSKLYAIAAK